MNINKKYLLPLAGTLLVLAPGGSQASPDKNESAKTDQAVQKLMSQASNKGKRASVIVRLKGKLSPTQARTLTKLGGDVTLPRFGVRVVKQEPTRQSRL